MRKRERERKRVRKRKRERERERETGVDGGREVERGEEAMKKGREWRRKKSTRKFGDRPRLVI